MPITTSWHSARKESEVYHNNSGCTEENNIEPYNVKEGTGNKRLCKHCERLNNEERYGRLGLFGGFVRSYNLAAFAAMKKQEGGK